MIRFLFLIGFSLLLIGCGDDRKKYANHSFGEMTIYADPSNKSLLEALTDIYMVKYPKVEFKIIYQPENEVLKNLLDTIAEAAFINQPLTEEQAEHINQKTKITPRSTLLAYDAAIFITSQNNPKDSITMEEVKEGILEESLQIVFDDGNSGNFNTVRDKLNLEMPEGKKIKALENAEQVIEFVQKSHGSIGVIGLNEISETDNPKVKEILKDIKVLPVVDENGVAIEANQKNMLHMKYPFYKGVWFIVREPGFAIGSGFSRFAGSQQGQLIVRREGLQPNYLWERQVQINLKSVE